MHTPTIFVSATPEMGLERTHGAFVEQVIRLPASSTHRASQAGGVAMNDLLAQYGR